MRSFTVGVLYESDEWSDHKLAVEIENAIEQQDALTTPIEVKLINMELPNSLNEALDCDMLVSRVFASAQFRGHDRSLEAMKELCEAIETDPGKDITLINAPQAHCYEINKQAATTALAEAGLCTPKIYACGTPGDLREIEIPYPSLIKPNCGGRTTYTAILGKQEDLQAFLASVPDIDFLIEEYIVPACGYITRVEIVDGNVAFVVKRSIAPNGLSAYHLNSTYEDYSACPVSLLDEARKATAALGFTFGSFDIIETDQGNYFIDANSVSNVSEDCTELFNRDLMAEYAMVIAGYVQTALQDQNQGQNQNQN